MLAPTLLYVVGVGVLVSVRAGPGLAGTLALAVAVTGPARGSVPFTVAVLARLPASRSAWVTV